MEMRHSITYSIPTDDLTPLLYLEKVSTEVTSGMMVVRAGMGWVFELGLQPNMPFYQKKNLRLINQASFISLLLALPGSFLLLLEGFNHPISLLVSGVIALCLILALNAFGKVQLAQATFAFSPAATILIYTLLELSAGSLADQLTYILARQGLGLALLLPVMIYGFEKSRRWLILCLCVIISLSFDVESIRLGAPLMEAVPGISRGLFSVLSILQFTGMAALVLYLQDYTLKHEQQVVKASEKLQSMAIRDGMTGLFNHSFMEQLIEDAINRSKRSATPLTLLMIDVDNFKQINDTHGHNAGDEVLVHLAKMLEGSKRSTDYLGRWGGDELILLLTDTHLQGAARVAEKLRTLVENQTFPYQSHLTISLGASEYNSQDNLPRFIGRADAAMYRAKRTGRNRVEVQR